MNPRNFVHIEGNLTRDPEYKSEFGVLTFGVAVSNSGRKNKEYGAGFFDVVVYTNDNDFRAPGVAKNLIKHYNDKTLAKGVSVAVQGELLWDAWDQDEKTRSKVTIVADNVQVRYYKKDDEDAPAGGTTEAPAKAGYAGDSF